MQTTNRTAQFPPPFWAKRKYASYKYAVNLYANYIINYANYFACTSTCQQKVVRVAKVTVVTVAAAAATTAAATLAGNMLLIATLRCTQSTYRATAAPCGSCTNHGKNKSHSLGKQ